MSGFIFGRPVNKATQTAIELKQNLIGTRDGNKQHPYVAREFFNLRSPWVRLSSSVQLNDITKAEYFGVEIGDELAKQNILTSFDIYNNEALLDSTQSDYFGGFYQHGVNSTVQGTISYEELGPRPRPGITSVKVTSHGMYGALRTVTVSFKCWTPFQLDIIDNLYMRPGYTVLLEFGHTHYLEKLGDEIIIEDSIVPLDFFKEGYLTDSDDFNKVYQDIQKLKSEYGGAYEGFLGLVKNFNWSLQTDGSYACSIDLVSKGELIESLVIDVGADLDENGNLVEDNMIWKKLWNLVGADRPYNDPSTVQYNPRANETDGVWSYIVSQVFGNTVDKNDATPEKYSDRRFSSIYTQAFNVGDEDETRFFDQTFINFHLFNSIVNRFLLRHSTSDTQSILRFDTEFENSTYYTNNLHISINPLVCLLPKWGTTPSIFTGFKLAERPLQPVTSDSIGEILLNVEFLKKKIQENLQSNGTLAVKDMYSSIFKGIEEATGGINKFELHCDEDNTFYIVDRKRIGNTEKLPDPLQIYGLNSIVKGFNLVSRLSPKLSTQMAIAAQDSSSNLGLDVTAFRNLNQGLIDGVTQQKLSIPAGIQPFKVKEVDGELEIEWSDQLESLCSAVGRLYVAKGSATTISEQIRVMYASFVNRTLEATTTAHASFAIPFELTLTIDGTGGFTVGETFEIDGKLLPLTYKRIIPGDPELETNSVISDDTKVSFIITGLEQSVTRTSWDTIIKSQIYLSDTKSTVKSKEYTPKGRAVEEDNSNSTPSPSGNSPEWPYYSDSDAVPDSIYSPSTAAGPVSNRNISLNNHIKTKYIPALNKITGYNKGLKLLATVMTSKEGFYPNTRSYKTNNPGNIGNTDVGANQNFDTLENGIAVQLSYLQRVANGTHSAYPVGKNKDLKPYYSPEIARNSATYGLTPYLPGYKFEPYTGTLEQFVKIYAAGARAGNSYLSDIISYFKANGYTIDEKTTLTEISKLT